MTNPQALRPSPQIVANWAPAFVAFVLFALPDAISVASPPEIEVVVADTERAGRYSETLVKLAPADQHRQGRVLRDFIDVFLIGVDVSKPGQIDLLTGESPTRYRLHIPIEDFRDFRFQNLKPVGISSNRVLGSTDLYRLGGRQRGQAFRGWMRYANGERGDYAFIAEEQDEVPKDLDDPSEDIKARLAGEYDAAFGLTNTDAADADQRSLEVQERLGRYLAERDETVDAMKPARGETPEQFEYRKLLTSHQFDDYAMYYAEAATFDAFLALDLESEKTGRIDVSMTALPETRLDGILGRLGESASRFAAIAFSDDPVLSGRVNLTFDDYRKNQLQSQLRAWRAAVVSGIETDDSRSEEEKAAGEKAVGMLVEGMRKVVVAGDVDAFIEMTAANGENQSVGAVHVPNGNEFTDILKAFENTRSVTELEMNVGKVGDVDLHRVVVDEESFADLVSLIGSREFIAGIGPNTLWAAAGEGAEDRIRQSIEKLDGEPVLDTATVFRADAKLAGIVDLVVSWLPPSDEMDQREMLLAALKAGDDAAFIEFRVDEGQLSGELTFNSGLLGYVGRYLAWFSKENLDG